jgi:hypothetical protein
VRNYGVCVLCGSAALKKNLISRTFEQRILIAMAAIAAVPTAIELTGVTSEPGLNGVYEVNGTFPHNESSRTQYMKKGSRCKCVAAIMR